MPSAPHRYRTVFIFDLHLGTRGCQPELLRRRAASSTSNGSARLGVRLGEATLRTPLVVLLATIVFPTVATAAEFAHAKAGVTFAQLEADSDACVQEAKTGRTSSGGPAYMPNAGVTANAGAALAVGLLEGMAQGRAQNTHVERCMRRRGYAKLQLTGAELAGFKAVRGEQDRRAWFDSWLQQAALRPRVAAALTPVVPALPSAPTGDAYAIHGVRLVPESISVPSTPFGQGVPVFTAQATYRSSARVTETFELGGILKARFEKDAVLHLVDERPEPDDFESSRWCGPLTHPTIWGKRVTRAGCVQSIPEGYAWNLWPEEPRPLLTQSSAAPLGGVVKAGSLRLEPLTADAKTHAIEMRLVGLTRDDLTLELLSLASPKPAPLWRRTVALDASGRAVVPFWDQQLVLTRTGRSVVSATFEKGDGRSLAFAEAAKHQR